MYAIVKTGGKQYRVEEGQALLVERLPTESGAACSLQPLLYVDGSTVVDGSELGNVNVEAKVLGHERGPKLRIVKFKPKHGYRRRTGHRQELTRLEVTGIKLVTTKRRQAAAGSAPEAPASSAASASAGPAVPAAPASSAASAAETRAATAPQPEVTDGA